MRIRIALLVSGLFLSAGLAAAASELTLERLLRLQIFNHAFEGFDYYYVIIEDDRPQTEQAAYSLYRQAIDLAVPKLMSAAEVCNKGGGEVGRLDWATTGPVLRKAEDLLNQALSALGQ